ncbi:MAG: NAD(P)/FAD-dependent oxidoreductase, partial [Polyangiales bacterium]
MSDNSTYDVIVSGGGPGGSTLATLVAMQGHRVLLLERNKFPRHQIGESLLPSTVHGICSLLGVTDELKQQNFPRKHGASFRWGKSPDLWAFDFSDLERLNAKSAGWAYQVERSKFDKILLDNARKKGVEVREEHTVTELLHDGDRATGVRYTNAAGLESTATARFVVDASGHTSKVFDWVGERVYSNFFQNIALFGYYEGGKRVPAPRQGNILCAAFAEGWFWYIPLSDTLT